MGKRGPREFRARREARKGHVRRRRPAALARAADERRALALAHSGPPARRPRRADGPRGERRARLIEEAALAAGFLKAHAKADKINVGALGNAMRQLHLHVVARLVGDAAWAGAGVGLWRCGALRGGAGAGADRGGAGGAVERSLVYGVNGGQRRTPASKARPGRGRGRRGNCPSRRSDRRLWKSE